MPALIFTNYTFLNTLMVIQLLHYDILEFIFMIVIVLYPCCYKTNLLENFILYLMKFQIARLKQPIYQKLCG